MKGSTTTTTTALLACFLGILLLPSTLGALRAPSSSGRSLLAARSLRSAEGRTSCKDTILDPSTLDGVKYPGKDTANYKRYNACMRCVQHQQQEKVGWVSTGKSNCHYCPSIDEPGNPGEGSCHAHHTWRKSSNFNCAGTNQKMQQKQLDCKFLAPPAPAPPPPPQPATTGFKTMTDAQKVQIANRFAPYIYFHPLETFGLGDPLVFLSRARIAKVSDLTDLGDATEERLLATSANECKGSDDCFLYNPNNRNGPPLGVHGTSQDDIAKGDGTKMQVAGSGYDGNGHSMAPVYVGMAEDEADERVILTFWFWYEWNGCGTMRYRDGSAAGDSENFLFCPFGFHEGDWESIQVAVSKDMTTVLGWINSIHNWEEFHDCSKESCRIAGGTHLQIFPALGGHPTQANPTTGMVHAHEAYCNLLGGGKKIPGVPGGAYLELTGVTGDENTNKLWMPNNANLRLIPSEENLRSGGGCSSRDWTDGCASATSWMAFPGRWGYIGGCDDLDDCNDGRKDTLIVPIQQPKCARADWSTYSGCDHVLLKGVDWIAWSKNTFGALANIFSAKDDSIRKERQGGGPHGPGRPDKRAKTYGVNACKVATWSGLFATGMGSISTMYQGTNVCWEKHKFYAEHMDGHVAFDTVIATKPNGKTVTIKDAMKCG